MVWEMAPSNPWGKGPGQTEVYFGGRLLGIVTPHSSYLRVLFEIGYVGELIYLSLLIYLLVIGLKMSLWPWQFSKISALVTSIYIGLLQEAFVIDTVYWRHFWIIAGMICGLNALYINSRKGIANSNSAHSLYQGVGQRDTMLT